MSRRFYLEDAQGNRLADLHPGAAGTSIMVPLSGRLFLREPGRKLEYIVPQRRLVKVSARQARTSSTRSRGAEHEAFRQLFAEPFDRRALVAYRARPRVMHNDTYEASTVDWLRPALGVFSLVALATAVTFTGLTAHEKTSIGTAPPNDERLRTNQIIKRNNAIAVTAYIASAAAAAGFLAWTFWPKPQVKVQVSGLNHDGPYAQMQVWW